MVEPSKKRKGSSSRSQRHSEAQETQIPSSISSSSLFSSEEQRIRYTNLVSSRSIIDPKFIDMDFFSNESFECIQAFENSNLIPFMSLKLSVYSELVRPFNLVQCFIMTFSFVGFPLFLLCYFPFFRFLCLFMPFYIFIFLWSTRVLPLLLRSPQFGMRKSDLRSSFFIK